MANDNESQLPIHIVKHKQLQDITEREKELAEGMEQAQLKAEHVAGLFPPGIEHFITAETEDGQTSFYLNFKMEF
jgi:hypothetical protein